MDMPALRPPGEPGDAAGGGTPHETHEQFLQRASRIFPVDSSLRWTRFERAVFNNLMAKLIHRYGYAAISDAMLQWVLDEMRDIASRVRPRLPH